MCCPRAGLALCVLLHSSLWVAVRGGSVYGLVDACGGGREKQCESYCICTVHVIRLLNCQYQHMHNFNVTG